MDNFTYNVAWIRKKYGMSKKDMAEIMHVGVAGLSKLERGEIPKRMSLDVLFYLSDHFGIPCDNWLKSRFDDEKELP